jgi:hypothetical protein
VLFRSLGFALADATYAVAAAFLIFSFVGTGSTFLAFAIMAAKRGLTSTRRGAKAFFYLGGLAEGTETIVFFVIVCLQPDWFPSAALIFGSLCVLTAAGRGVAGWRAFSSRKS